MGANLHLYWFLNYKIELLPRIEVELRAEHEQCRFFIRIVEGDILEMKLHVMNLNKLNMFKLLGKISLIYIFKITILG